ncbi:MAG: glycosyltransferase [Candidatus Krumholzibacteriia bacterium]
MSLAAGRSVVVLNTSASWGGNEHWAVQLAAGLRDRGARVTFCWSHAVVGDRVRDAGLVGRRLRARGDLDLPAILELRRILVAERAQAVVATRWREYLHAGVASRLAGRPRVVLRLGLQGVPRRDLKRRLIFRLADRVLVNAPEIRESLARSGWIDPSKLVVVLNGLDLAAWPPRWDPAAVRSGRALRDELRIPLDAPLVLAVGAFSPQKDFAGLLAAVALVRDRRPDLKVLILGDGPLRAELLAERSRLRLDQVVLLPGFRRDVPAAMAAADLFVLSSRNEGMARVLIEAAASGLPAVATDVSGTRLAVRDGTTGVVVPPGDPAGLADAVDGLLGRPERRQAMGRAGRDLAARSFVETRMLDEAIGVLFGPGAE